ncbi:LuxR family two component transcriptional regulator [Microterricola gilva]|uniref:LuxR family two component transcriptional regulator n=1 Tax=Microterricola gilva TaxID=393267 RepID=A0A4Q8AR53_9MICO|nr:response regulator transcription factor [Microterricola gilva]RZU66613.1 LuxR family two component transcriptional regulator [Microterricola gilva]
MIRVVVADDHPIVRSGIVGLLRGASDIEVVGEARDGAEAVRLVAELAPELVLMDLRMPVLDGVAATAQIVDAQSGTRVLILTTYESDELILGAIEAGAGGYLLKAAPQEEILAGVRAVATGETVLAPSIAAKLVQRVRADAAGTGAAASATVALSPRELEVLRLVAAGQSNPRIAAALFIGEATVKTHLQHVFEKLEVSDRTRAVTRAMELGLL